MGGGLFWGGWRGGVLVGGIGALFLFLVVVVGGGESTCLLFLVKALAGEKIHGLWVVDDVELLLSYE